MVISRQSMAKLTAIYRTIVLYHEVKIESVCELRQIIHTLNLQILNRYWSFCLYEHPILFNESVLNILKGSVRDKPIFIGTEDSENSSEWDDLSQVDTEEIVKLVKNDNWKDIDESSIIFFDYKKDIEYVEGRVEYVEEHIENRNFLSTSEMINNYNTAVKSALRDYKIGLFLKNI